MKIIKAEITITVTTDTFPADLQTTNDMFATRGRYTPFNHDRQTDRQKHVSVAEAWEKGPPPPRHPSPFVSDSMASLRRPPALSE